MPMTMISVAARTMRAPKPVVRGEGVSSSLSHPQNHASGLLETGGACAIAAISTPANDYHCRFTDPEQIRRRILDAHPNRIARRKVHPVQCPLHVRQTLIET